MVAPKKEIKDQVLKEWLTEFTNTNTKQGYLAAVRKFKKNLGIKSLDEYLKNSPDATEDIKRFLISLEGKPSKTIAAYTAAVKSFFVDHNVPFDETQWRKLRRRGFMPKRVRAETRDKKPSKQQLKQILNYLDIKGRAMILFLVSSGARIGETLKLLEEDFDLEADPPKAHIRAEHTKGGVGARTVYFSFEARDAIRDWLNIKDTLKKKNGKKYGDNRVFGWSTWTARDMWNRAIRKANLDEKDKVTLRRVYHIHSLRKFFRTQIGLDLDTTHALMGHAEYLDSSYVRQDQGEIAKAYLEAMPNVSVYAAQDLELKNITEKQEIEMAEMRNIIEEQKQRLNGFASGIELSSDVEDQLESQRVQSEATSKRLVELEKKLRLLESPELRKLLKQLEDG